MEAATLGLLGGPGGGGAKETEKEYVGMSSKVSSYQNEAELELGLGLSLGGGGGGGGMIKDKVSPWGDYVKIKTAKDFPSGFSSKAAGGGSAGGGGVSGIKRGADCVGPPEVGYSASPVLSNQVVGWPPIRSYRINSLIGQTKSASGEEDKLGVGGNDIINEADHTLKKKINHGSNNNYNETTSAKERGNLGFVKVNMDGLQIGRKVDLNSHGCYKTLAQTLEEMFFKPSTTINLSRTGGIKKQTMQPSKLLDGSSEFVLTYEDKEGDWMLVGDVPWGMFLGTVKRLRIMKTCEANGLAPRFRETKARLATR